MFSQTMPIAAHTLLGTGLTTGVLGLMTRSHHLTGTGILLTVAALPPLIIHTLRNSQQATAQQLAEADNTGYRRALDHVARGLLDQHTKPGDPHPGQPTEAEQVTGAVIPLRPTTVNKPERKAQ